MPDTKMYFLGDASLANGFRLAGFEVLANADIDTMEILLKSLKEQRTKAFVILDHRLSESDSEILAELREEGGHILLSQVPPLNQPDQLHSSVDQKIAMLLGQQDKMP